MDKYVIKTKRKKEEKNQTKKNNKKLKQITIEALPRVVVVEEIERISAILEECKDTKTILSALNELKNVKPSKEILIETKIGHKINYLRKHDDAAIKNLARLIFKEWKSFYKQRRGREIIEVRSDAKSELTRMKARKLLADSLGKEVTDSLPEMIEREIYKITERKINQAYKRRVRKLCFTLKHRNEVREQVLNGTIQLEVFCKAEL